MFSIKTMKPDALVIPDIITPNEDGYNDYFEVKHLRANTTLKIFNRKGQEVYSNTNYQNNWDGRDNNGHPLSQDNYFYVLIIQGEAGEYKGSVFIKR
jgi:trimeric autotransporter adhesin